MSIAVVDLKEEEAEKKKSEEAKSREEKSDPESQVYQELLRALDKLAKGVEGDLSSLSRALRSLNRFRTRLSNVTWGRIVHFLIPGSHRQEFVALLEPIYPNWKAVIGETVRFLTGASEEEAARRLDDARGDVLKAVVTLVAHKERLAAAQLKKEKEEREAELKEQLEKDKPKGLQPTKSQIAAEEQKKKADEDVEMGEKDEKGKEKEIKAAIQEFEIDFMPLKGRRRKRVFFPETYLFMQLLVALQFFDRNEYSECLKILERLIEFTKRENRRTSDMLSARIYQFYSLCYQRLGSLTSIRTRLFSEYQTACLQQNEPAQSMLINLVLQNYLAEGLYAQARKFADKAEFLESSETSQFARYHYYRGRIDAVQLRYEQALFHMQQSIRRAPQSGSIGFKLACTKWLIVVHLLMGDIPDRALLTSLPGQRGAEELGPYLDVTEAVRTGNVQMFMQTLDRNHGQFQSDQLFAVLMRLRHNVIKTGLRKINRSYSRISLQDIQRKLALESVDDAYDIVAKAISDRVIDATIDFKNGHVQSRDVADLYATDTPYQQLATRVRFCLDIHTQAVKSLRYPPNEEFKNEEEKVEHDAQAAQEIADAIREAYEDDDQS